MPIPDEVRMAAERELDDYCRDAIPEHAQDRVRIGYLAKGMTITLFEIRPHFMNPSDWRTCDVARFRFNKTRSEWTLYWLDRDLKWHIYDRIVPSPDFRDLLQEVDDDPTGIFWG